VRDWLPAAEYLLAGGNAQVVFCERGVRSYDPELRDTLDLAGMALAWQLSHLPVIGMVATAVTAMPVAEVTFSLA
jgi:3-deoxy-7-phosphoheptulonate synthase